MIKIDWEFGPVGPGVFLIYGREQYGRVPRPPDRRPRPKPDRRREVEILALLLLMQQQ